MQDTFNLKQKNDMATFPTFKNLLLPVVLGLTTMFSLASCENKPKAKDPEEVAEDMNEGKEDPAAKERDENFLMKAAELNLEEIQLGQLAQTKSANPDVQALGKMMVDGHSKAMSDLTALAGRKSIAIPTSPTKDVQDLYQRMSEKTGNDFDKDFCDKMVSGHKDAIDKFENAANNSQDAEIKAWASSMLPDLRTHLEHAQMCKDKVDKM